MDYQEDVQTGETTEEVKPRRGSYFLDEAGDATLFDAKGRSLVGAEGCSRFIMLGLLDVKEPVRLAQEMNALRLSLLADPYFMNVPSMQKEQRKTALAFHAKDDVPEVRREVYSLLMRHELRFFAVVQDKQQVLEYVRRRNEEDFAFRYHPNQAYDYQVKCLFSGRLHKEDVYDIHFSRRGKSDRTEALREALNMQRQWYIQRFNITDASPVLNVSAHYPWEIVGLQAVDYFLWALQRLYEKHESRYLEYVWSQCALINDRNLEGRNGSGVYFTRKKPPSLTALKEVRGI